MSNLPYTFFGGHGHQTLFVSVEVSSPEGNFDILGKFDFETTKTWILHAWSIFLTGLT
jgi:hypothetical protein